MSPPARFCRRSWALPLSLTVAGVLACVDTDVKPPPTAGANAPSVYWSLNLNHRAVTMTNVAPYDTLTLVATPYNPRGEPLSGLPAPTYESKDLDRLLVTPDGVVHALATGSQTIPVVVTLTANGITHADTALVRVVNKPAAVPVLGSLSIHPVPPDSAKAGLASGFFAAYRSLVARAADTAGTAIPGLFVSFRSSDPAVADVGKTNGWIATVRPGAVTFYATATAYGILKADTLPYRIGYSAFRDVSVAPATPLSGGAPVPVFRPSEIQIGVGGIVYWFTGNPGEDGAIDTDITFADDDLPNIAAVTSASSSFWDMAGSRLGAPGSFVLQYFCQRFTCEEAGNVVTTAAVSGAARVFLRAGTYDYHSTRLGISGRVIVVDER